MENYQFTGKIIKDFDKVFFDRYPEVDSIPEFKELEELSDPTKISLDLNTYEGAYKLHSMVLTQLESFLWIKDEDNSLNKRLCEEDSLNYLYSFKTTTNDGFTLGTSSRIVVKEDLKNYLEMRFNRLLPIGTFDEVDGDSPFNAALYYLDKKYEECMYEDQDDKTLDELKQKAISLISAAVEVLKPQTIATYLFVASFKYRIVSDVLEGEFLNQVFEVLREHGAKFGDSMHQVLSSLQAIDYVIEQKTKNKYLNTQLLINYIVANTCRGKYCKSSEKMFNEIIVLTRYIREDIVNWMKSKTKNWETGEIKERETALPLTFDVVDIPKLLQCLYNFSIFELGDIKAFTDDIDPKIRRLSRKIERLKDLEYGLELTEDDYEDDEKGEIVDELNRVEFEFGEGSLAGKKLSRKEYIEELEKEFKVLDDKRTLYLTTKSNISFLFQECTSHEAVGVAAYPTWLVNAIMSAEPRKTMAAHDIPGVVGSLFVKRDFHPMGHSSINPYYIHYKEGDLSNTETHWLAKTMGLFVHAQMRSVIAPAPIENFTNLNITLTSLYARATLTLKELAESIRTSINCEKPLICDKHYENKQLDDKFSARFASFRESILSFKTSAEGHSLSTGVLKESEIEAIENMLKIASSITDEEMADIRNTYGEEGFNAWYNVYRVSFDHTDFTLANMYKVYKEYLSSLKNVVGQIKYVVDNICNNECKVGANVSRTEGKPIKNFWPITTQYEYEIEEDTTPQTPEQIERQYMNNLKPGDIMHHRYGTRYQGTNPDD